MAGFIYRCSVCKFVAHTDERPMHLARPRVPQSPDFDGMLCCGKNHHEMAVKHRVGKRGVSACGAKCRFATGPACDCNCGGFEHGRGHSRSMRG